MFLHLIWFLQLISLIPQTIFTIHRFFDIPNSFSLKNYFRVFQEFSSYIVLDTLQILVFFLCAATMCILLYWADQHCPSAGGGANNNYQPLQEENERITFPDGQISALSSFFYSYAVQLIWKGYRGTVGYQDLWTFQKWMKVETLWVIIFK
jgi:hypothetical protein